ncbi:MAG: SDR family oxidoreductase [Actinobacteria bacterium]|nr:MAG: SDR family oxidoreductase [Actinomycetota bacterium]
MTSADDTPVPRFADRLRLDGRGFIVVGAGLGMGRQTAHALAQQGARVLCVDIDGERATEVAAEVGGIACVADGRERADVNRIVEQAIAEFGALNGVVDIVGMARWSRLVDTSDEEREWVFGMVFDHAFLLAQVAGAAMSESGGGTMVFVASISGVRTAPFHAAYGAAKAALLSLVRTAALELAPRKIRVNAVVPGAVNTPRMQAMAAARGEVNAPVDTRLTPLAKLAETSDLASAILFLSSDLAGQITGQALAVDGGALQTLYDTETLGGSMGLTL